jgi:hypothetical protein
MAGRGLAVLLVVPLLAIGPPRAAAADPPIDWDKAVADLRGERDRAVACAARARTLDAEKADGLSFRYGMAKAEVDAVIAGLKVRLTQGGAPGDLQGLQARMRKGVEEREAFCRLVLERAPLEPGQKGILADVLGALAEPLVNAVRSLWEARQKASAAVGESIRYELEAARWPAFSDVPPQR